MTNHSSGDRQRELLELAAALPREVDPPAEAWEVVRAQITEDARLRASGAGLPQIRPWQRPAVLAAAALLLIAASSAVTAALIARNDSMAAMPLRGPMAEGPLQPTATLAEFTARENDYLQLVNTLLVAIEDGSSGLAPETIATIRSNLLVIDAAILDARRALASDPANRRLVEILTATYEKKLDLLRRTSAMARS